MKRARNCDASSDDSGDSDEMYLCAYNKKVYEIPAARLVPLSSSGEVEPIRLLCRPEEGVGVEFARHSDGGEHHFERTALPATDRTWARPERRAEESSAEEGEEGEEGGKSGESDSESSSVSAVDRRTVVLENHMALCKFTEFQLVYKDSYRCFERYVLGRKFEPITKKLVPGEATYTTKHLVLLYESEGAAKAVRDAEGGDGAHLDGDRPQLCFVVYVPADGGSTYEPETETKRLLTMVRPEFVKRVASAVATVEGVSSTIRSEVVLACQDERTTRTLDLGRSSRMARMPCAAVYPGGKALHALLGYLAPRSRLAVLESELTFGVGRNGRRQTGPDGESGAGQAGGAGGGSRDVRALEASERDELVRLRIFFSAVSAAADRFRSAS